MLNLEPESAQLLSILVRSSRSTRLLEIGTSNGYSTIWLAWATRMAGGHITSGPLCALVALDGSPLAEKALAPAANLVAALAAPAQGALHLTQVVQVSSTTAEEGYVRERKPSLARQNMVKREKAWNASAAASWSPCQPTGEMG